jgi:hypothetical protein
MLGTSQHALRGTMALSLRRYHPIFFPLFNQKALLSSLYPYTTADIVSLNQDFHLSSRTQNSVAASASFSGTTNEFIVSFMPLQYKCNAIHYSSMAYFFSSSQIRLDLVSDLIDAFIFISFIHCIRRKKKNNFVQLLLRQ